MNSQARTLFWLLAAATIAVDLLAVSWLHENQMSRSGGALYEALCFGQLSAAAIWFVFGRNSLLLRASVLGLVLSATAIATAELFEFEWRESFGFFGGFVTLLVIALWILRHSPAARSSNLQATSVWQFSLGQLLILMTIVCLLLVSLRGSDLWEIAEAVVVDLVSTSALVVAIVTIWIRPWQLLSRLTMSLASALLFGCMTWVYDLWRADPLLAIGGGDLPTYFASSLIHAIFLLLWLSIGNILPAASPSGNADDMNHGDR